MSDVDSLSREELIGVIQRQRQAFLEQREVVVKLQEEVAVLKAEVEKLRSQLGTGGGGAPHWVKPNRAKAAKKRRKKRPNAFVRRSETPTEIVEHALERCPDCGRKLSGGTVKWKRQVIEITVAQFDVIEHRFIVRYCGVCRKSYVAKPDLSGEVVGKHRVGIRLMSLVAYLNMVGRMTKRTIQAFLESMYGLHLGLGEITKILHTVARCGEAERDKLLAKIRGSPYINADETGWREDGQNGYIWTFSTSDERYFIFRRSRSGQVAKEVIGEDYEGVAVTDCYSGYNVLLGDRQQCWAHLLRDVHKLEEENPDDEQVGSWANAVKNVYRRAKEFGSEREKDRWSGRLLFEGEIHRLSKPYLKSEAVQRVLAERLADHLVELFMFVQHPEVPSDNNGAERALRPAVIARKVCGGTRSQKGSETKMTLMTLFGTWRARKLNPMDACRALLAGRSVLFPHPA